MSGGLAELEARLARLVGVDAGPQKRTSGGNGYWGRGKTILADRSFWRQHGTVLARTLIGSPIAVGAVSLVGSAVWFVFLPVYYRWVDFHLGSWNVDTFEKSLLGIPFGLAGLVVALALVHWTARGWARVALPYLGPPRGPAKSFFVPHAAAVVLADLVVLIVWASVGGSVLAEVGARGDDAHDLAARVVATFRLLCQFVNAWTSGSVAHRPHRRSAVVRAAGPCDARL